jgi:SPP1 gp7 family putative phage head morphogenesis protein
MPDLSPGLIATAYNLPNGEAISLLDRKLPRATWSWQEVSGRASHTAFGIAKLTQLDLATDIQLSLAEAMREGTPFGEWKKMVIPELKGRGWWGKQDILNPATGRIENVLTGSPWRLETIYRTNLASAYQGARMNEQQALQFRRPYWQYIAVGDHRTRPSHMNLHGKILPANAPQWNSIYPPNGFNCRCRVRTLSQAQFDAMKGKTVAESRRDALIKIPDKGFGSAPRSMTFDPTIKKPYPGDLLEAYRTIVRPIAAQAASGAARSAPGGGRLPLASESREKFVRGVERLSEDVGGLSKDEIRNEFLTMFGLQKDQQTSFKYVISARSEVAPGSARMKRVTNAVDFLRRIVRRDINLDKSRISIDFDPKVKRASAETGRFLVRMAKKSPYKDETSVIVHEITHIIEMQRFGTSDTTRNWLRSRTKGERLTPLGPGYEKDEVTRKDKFRDAYVGRDYGAVGGKDNPLGTYAHKGTEALTMGTQWMYEDALAFAKADPDHFEMVLEALGLARRK